MGAGERSADKIRSAGMVARAADLVWCDAQRRPTLCTLSLVLCTFLRMKALLVRIGVDQAYGGWNAPADAEGRFVYVPIPEKRGTAFHAGLERRYGEVLPALQRFSDDHGCDLRFPRGLLEHPMHLDP